MSILVITTGGTIGAMPYEDIRHQPLIKTMPADGTDIVQAILKKDFGQYGLRFIKMEHRDSNFIDEEYRGDIVKNIAQAPEDRILVTHGTDTILATAEFLYRQQESVVSLRGKAIFLTGSMVAMSCGSESDGFMNMSFALAQLSSPLASGVYIALCDYDDARAQIGWSPRLHRFAPGKYQKMHDPDNMHRDRLSLLARQEENASN